VKDPVDQSTRDQPSLPTHSDIYAETTAASGTSLLDADEMRRSDQGRVRSPFQDAMRRFMENWAAVISLVIIVLLILMAIFAPLLHTQNPSNINALIINQGPSPQHWFGTATEGQDLYSRILYGMRVPLIVSLVGTVLTVFIGLVLGLVSAYFGGWVDSLISRFTDFMFAFPVFLLTIVLVTLFSQSLDASFPAGIGRTILLTSVFALVSWPPLMRFVRSLGLSMKEQQFIEAARTVGTSPFQIIRRHMVPNVWGLVLIQGALTVASLLGFEAVLSILGMGVQQPTPDLGYILSDQAQNMAANDWGVFFPSVFLVLLILSFTFLGDGIRDAVDPRSSR
jgi:ABC-type dipeptide/oligopeptide/nickel transport system permease subunit